ncbi:hypothetical protein D3C78_520420 [compost metagenome]
MRERRGGVGLDEQRLVGAVGQVVQAGLQLADRQRHGAEQVEGGVALDLAPVVVLEGVVVAFQAHGLQAQVVVVLLEADECRGLRR